MRGIAEDLGVERGTLRHWLGLYGTGKKTAADGTLTRSPLKPVRSTATSSSAGAGSATSDVGETPEQRIVRLEAENAQLRVAQEKLVTEREILRQAAKYFAGETNW